MPFRLDHVDLRVPRLDDVRQFYTTLLAELGFTRDARIDGWLQFEREDGVDEFFGVTESPHHRPNENRIAFRANSRAEVDRLATVIRPAGARNIEGPGFESSNYYAVFFEDPCGNRLEICHRAPGRSGEA